VVATRDEPEAHRAIFDTLSEGNRKWAGKAPVLMIVAAHRMFARNGAPNRHAGYDTGAAMAYLTLEATSRGLVVHQMGGFSAQRTRTQLGIPEDFEPMAAVAVGHPASLEAIPPDLTDREQATRARKRQSEIVFRGRWGS